MFPKSYPSFQAAKATLVEDFIVTARETKGPYCRIQLEDTVKDKPENCPLARMPDPFFIYPLKKDDVVFVQADGDNPAAMVVYGVDFDIPAAVLDAVAMPTASSFEFPTEEDTTAFHYISKDLSVITTDTYVIMKSGDSIMLFSPDKVIQYMPDTGEHCIRTGKYTIETDKAFTINAKQDYDFKVAGKFKMVSNNVGLKAIMDKVFETLSDLYSKMGTFDAHTHADLYIPYPGGVPGPPVPVTSVPTSAPTGASADAPLLDSWAQANVDQFFKET